MSKRSSGSASSDRKRQKSNGSLDSFFGIKKAPEVIELSDDDEEPIAGPSKVKAEDAEDVKPVVTPSRKGKEKAIVSPFAKTSAVTVAPDYPALANDILAFSPARDIDTSTWPRSKDGSISVPYAFLTAAFVLISATRSRLIIVTVLTNVYRTITHYESGALLDALYLITNHIGPSYEGVEMGISGAAIHKAVKDVTGVSDRELKRLWDIHGDMGDVGFHAKSNVRTIIPAAPLTVSGVYGSLKRIAGLKGQGVGAQKQAICTKMLVAAKGEEVRFLLRTCPSPRSSGLTRTVVSHLRIGAVRLTNLSALARSFCLTRADGQPEEAERTDEFWIGDRDGLLAIDKKAKDEPRRQTALASLARAEAVVRRVFVQHPNYSHIVPALLSDGLEHLAENVPLAIGTPLNPMLGQITRDLTEIPGRIGETAEFAAEWKYDGQRVQLHARRRKDGEPAKLDERLPGSKASGGKWVGDGNMVYCRLFSRHLEDMTDKYPDILSLVPELLSDGVESIILDAEICAIEPATGNLLTFQSLASRARKDVQLGAVSVRVCIFAFDLLYLNGEPLLEKSFRDRRALLKSRLPPLAPADPAIARFDHVNSIICTSEDLEPVRDFMEEAIKNKCEGLMVKILDDQVLEGAAAATVDDSDEEQKTPRKGKGKAGSRRKALLSSYEPDKRKDSWLKVKKDYGDIGDSLDLSVHGTAWVVKHRGGGVTSVRESSDKRSPILLALYDPETGSYQAVCKCISGFTDQMYKDLNARYPKGSDTCRSTPFVDVDTGGLRPAVYWKPSEVWQIRGADITLSPVYPAAKGLVPGARGCSLRFPRFDKLRDDKSVEQATTPQQLADAYQRQESGGTKSATDRSGPTPAPKAPASGDEDEEDDDEEELMDVIEF